MNAADEDSESEEDHLVENKNILTSTYLECDGVAANASVGFGNSTKSGNNTNNAENLFVFAGSNKAGMTTKSEEEQKQKKIIYDASNGSKYHNRAERADDKANERIAAMKEKLKTFTQTELNMAKRELDANLAALEKHRSFDRHIVRNPF